MPLQPVVMSHIAIDERGVARIAGTRFNIRFIIVEATALGMTPEQIVEAHPDMLNLAQVHAALSYYYDNKAAMDAEIAEGKAEAERLKVELPEPPILERLRARKRKRDEDAA